VLACGGIGVAFAVMSWAGASRSGVMTGASSSEAKPPDQEPKVDPADRLPKTLNNRFKGRNAEQWGAGLLDRDQWVSSDAEVGTKMMGEEGLRFSLKALESKFSDVRWTGAKSLHESAKDYPDVFLPKLLAMLDTPNENEWEVATGAIERCHFKDGLPAVEKAAGQAKNNDVRKTLERVAKTLKGQK